MRFKFTGKYGDLKEFGFEYQCSEGTIWYFWEHPEGKSSYIGIEKAGGFIRADRRAESALTLILPYIEEHLNGVVPDHFYYNSKTDTVSHIADEMDVEYEFCKDIQNTILVDTKRHEQGLPRLRTVFDIYNDCNEINVLYELYKKNYLTLVDDASYPRDRVFKK